MVLSRDSGRLALALALLSLSGGCGGGGGGSGTPNPDLTPDPNRSIFRAVPAFGTPADGTSAVQIEMRLVNFLGDPMEGATVELAVSGSRNLLQPLPTAGADGRTNGALASRASEQKSIRAFVTMEGHRTELPAFTADFLEIPPDSFFVRASGSDANSGRSPLAAWRTLQHAFAELLPGSTLYVGAGEYAGPLTLQLDSSDGPPTVIVGDRSGEMTGDSGRIEIKGDPAGWALRLLQARNVVLRGLTLSGGAAGLLLRSTRGVRVLDCRTLENEVGLVADGADGLVVQDCRISANVSMGVRIQNARNSRFDNNLVYANLGDGLVLSAPADGVQIRSNTFFRNGGAHLREESAGGTGVIEENILSEAGADPLALADPSGYVSRANLLWSTSLPLPVPIDGYAIADPRLGDPFGSDGILGGRGAEDDDFRLERDSVALDLGVRLARDVVLGSQESLATRTSRLDGVLEASGEDQPTTNIGFHTPSSGSDFESVPSGAGRFLHSEVGSVHGQSLTWERAQVGVLRRIGGPSLESEVVYLEQRLSPLGTGEELVIAQVDTGTRGRIVVRRWNGRRWDDPALVPFRDDIALEEVVDRRFGVQYEARSGRAVLVMADDDGIPGYCLLENGRWSVERPVAELASGQGRVRWVELVAHGNSNELALMTLDDQRDLVVMLWDGAQWGQPIRLESNTVFAPGWRPFHGGFESLSGDLLVSWGFSNFIEETRWATLERGTGVWRTGQHTSTEAIGAHIIIAADPSSNRLAATMGEAGFDDDVIATIWDGNEWVHTAELTLDGPLENRLMDVAWLGNSGIACSVFRRQGNTGSFNMAMFFPTGWRIQPDVVLGAGRAAKIHLQSVPSRFELLGQLLDQQGRLFGLHFDGTEFQLLNGGVPLAQGFDPQAPGLPLDIGLRPPEPELGR